MALKDRNPPITAKSRKFCFYTPFLGNTNRRLSAASRTTHEDQRRPSVVSRTHEEQRRPAAVSYEEQDARRRSEGT